MQFDKGKPFFDMVGTFLVSLSTCPAVFDGGNPMKYDKSQYITIGGVQGNGKHLYPLEIYEQAQANHITMPVYLLSCCMMLANTAYESVKEQNDHSLEFEFFRHVRNASSHKNVFTFHPHEPARRAQWRGAIIDHERKGNTNPMHGQPCFGPLLGPADLIDLLAEIEKKIDT